MSEERIPKYKIGDKVILNVGGPVMAIESPIEHYKTKEFEGVYYCQWFAGKKLENGKFPEDSLVPYEGGDTKGSTPSS